jgi:phage/plasmid primase-like uncharacterized protein
MSDAVADFVAALRARDIIAPPNLIADGKLHRCDATGRHGKGDAAYLLHLDDHPVGGFENHRDGRGWELWRGKANGALSEAEQERYKRRIEEARAQRDADNRRRRADAAARASRMWSDASTDPNGHPYLAAKHIEPHGSRLWRDKLVVPVLDVTGALHSLQLIDRAGGKRFLTDGRTSAGCFTIGDIEERGAILVAEGFATAATLHEATGYPAVAAFNAGNLAAVAQAIRTQYPAARLVIAADDDHRTDGNPGLTKAREAAALVGGVVVVPDFGPGRPERMTDFNDLGFFAGHDRVREVIDAALAGKAETESAAGVRLDDFYAYMPMHSYIFLPTRALWPAGSLNARIPPIKVGTVTEIKASTWLDQNRPVEQMTWAPGLPEIIENRLLYEGGWIAKSGVRCFNQYLPPAILPGDAKRADRWLDHIRLIYPEDAEHVLCWLAHRVQRPHEKLNHALVLGGSPGIGKDTLLEPVKYAIGPWNFQEASPTQVLGRFNGFLKSVILRISEARDLGEFDRFKFYDHTKSFIAAPPDTLRLDEKHLREYSILNVCGVVITTNHKTDGIYLPAEDRRHFVAWSDLTKEDERFAGDYWNRIYAYYQNGGTEAVAAYLAQLDIRSFDPKAPPPKTPAFWAVVDASRSPEEPELADVLDLLGNPDAVTLGLIAGNADAEFGDWLKDRRNRRAVPHRLERCGYVPVRNPDDVRDGQWKIGGKRQTVYARQTLSLRDQIAAARALRARW